MINYDIRDQALEVLGADMQPREVRFPWPVRQVLECCGVLVVRIEPDAGAQHNQNVYGVSQEGKILWQVAATTAVYDDSPYTDLVRQGDSVVLMNWDGLELQIDPRTGAEQKRSHGR